MTGAPEQAFGAMGMPDEDGDPPLRDLLDMFGADIVKEARHKRAVSRLLAMPSMMIQLIEVALTPFSKEECRQLKEWEVLSKTLPQEWALWLIPLIGRERDVKHAYICAELLSSDNVDIPASLLSNRVLLAELFKFLDLEHVNSWLAVHLTDCIRRLLMTNPELFVLHVIEGNVVPGGPDNHVSKLVRSMIHPPFGDLLSALLGTTLNDGKTHIVPKAPEWWLSNGLFDEVISLFAPNAPPEGVIWGFRFLSDIVRRRFIVYINEMVKPKYTEKILDYMFAAERLDGNALVFQEGAAYITLLIQSIQSDYNTKLRCLPITDRLDDFNRMLATPGPLEPVAVTWQPEPLNPPLGQSRLRAVDIIAALHLVRDNVFDALAASGVMKTLLALCREYHMNNILHSTVTSIIDSYAGGIGLSYKDSRTRFHYNSPFDYKPMCFHIKFLDHLLRECKIVDFLLECWEENNALHETLSYTRGNHGLFKTLAGMLRRLSKTEFKRGVDPDYEMPWPPIDWDEKESPTLLLLKSEVQRMQEAAPEMIEEEAKPFSSISDADADSDSKPKAQADLIRAAEEPSWIEQASAKSDDGASEDSASKYSVRLTTVSRYHLDAEKEHNKEDPSEHDPGFAACWSNDFGEDMTNLMEVDKPTDVEEDALAFDSLAALNMPSLLPLNESTAVGAAAPEPTAPSVPDRMKAYASACTDEPTEAAQEAGHAEEQAAEGTKTAAQATADADAVEAPGFNSFNFWRLPTLGVDAEEQAAEETKTAAQATADADAVEAPGYALSYHGRPIFAAK